MAAVIAPHLERLPAQRDVVRLLPDTAIESRSEQRDTLCRCGGAHARERQLLVGGETKQLLSVEARQLRRLVDLRVGRVQGTEPLVYMSH